MRAVRTFAKRKICCVAGNSFFSSGAAAFGAGFAVCRKSVVWLAGDNFIAGGAAVIAGGYICVGWNAGQRKVGCRAVGVSVANAGFLVRTQAIAGIAHGANFCGVVIFYAMRRLIGLADAVNNGIAAAAS